MKNVKVGIKVERWWSKRLKPKWKLVNDLRKDHKFKEHEYLFDLNDEQWPSIPTRMGVGKNVADRRTNIERLKFWEQRLYLYRKLPVCSPSKQNKHRNAMNIETGRSKKEYNHYRIFLIRKP